MADDPVTTRGNGLSATVHVDDRLDAELNADAGAVVAVIGPNGAGKTTLLRALAGLVPMTGSIEVDGWSWTRPVRLVRDRNVGLVFQDQLLFPHLDAVDNVAFGLRARGTSRAESDATARDWLARFGIADLADRRPAQLSGGQAQRVAIARALAPAPSLLLLDEPFAGLDVGVATALRIELARHLASYDGVTLLVTHDALDALTLADAVLVVDEGRVAQYGSPQDVAARPRTAHVARLVGLNVIREDDRFRSFRPSAVTVSLGRPEGSARNQWHGTVLSAVTHGDAVRLLVAAGPQLIADVTPAATVELGLVPGREVWVSVKETAIQTYA
ncbi:MAG: phnT [Nocardioides sp.]|nr:phnT [Nocardioides sp.]